MPLLRVSKIKNDVVIGLWRITTEDDERLMESLPNEVKIQVSANKSPKRRSEIIATYALLHTMTGDHNIIIRHEKSGKPMLEGYNVSISHTNGLAAVILSKERQVAIDVEYISERVNKVAHIFLRPDEEAATTESRLLHWCAKETLYKLRSEEDLRFEDMRVLPQSDDRNDCITIEDMRTNKLYDIRYKYENGYIVTYSY